MDTLRELCVQNGKDYYERVCYIATDRSERMLTDIGQRGILAAHVGHYRLAQLDALLADVDLARAVSRVHLSGKPFRAIFLNYLLDSLPAAHLRVQSDGLGRLNVRTCLSRSLSLEENTPLSAEEIAAKAASRRPEDMRALVDLYPCFAVEYDYRPVDVHEVPYGDFAVKFGRPHGQVLHSYGAIQCLESCLSVLRDDGFILANDYAQPEHSDTIDPFVHQRFAGSVAIGLNFSLLKSYFEQSRGCLWVEPDEDNPDISTRLVGWRPEGATVERFHELFDKAAYEWRRAPEERARALLAQGRSEAALGAYCEALTRQPKNWVLIGEVARFLVFTLRDYAAGLQMAKAGLALNPSCSPDLWNTMGDSLFCLEQVEEAERTFRQALEIDPSDVRARFNLAYVYSHRNDQAAALKMIAEGLALDKRGEYRERLLQKQGEIVNRLAHRYQQEARFMADRVSRFLGPPPDGEPVAAQA